MRQQSGSILTAGFSQSMSVDHLKTVKMHLGIFHNSNAVVNTVIDILTHIVTVNNSTINQRLPICLIRIICIKAISAINIKCSSTLSLRNSHGHRFRIQIGKYKTRAQVTLQNIKFQTRIFIHIHPASVDFLLSFRKISQIFQSLIERAVPVVP